MTENERVKAVRKSMSLTQDDFGKVVGISGAAVSNIEKGSRNVTEQMRRAICREFHVRETWLREEIGEMFVPKSDEDEITEAVERLMGGESSAFKRRLVLVLSRLPEEE